MGDLLGFRRKCKAFISATPPFDLLLVLFRRRWGRGVVTLALCCPFYQHTIYFFRLQWCTFCSTYCCCHLRVVPAVDTSVIMFRYKARQSCFTAAVMCALFTFCGCRLRVNITLVLPSYVTGNAKFTKHHKKFLLNCSLIAVNYRQKQLTLGREKEKQQQKCDAESITKVDQTREIETPPTDRGHSSQPPALS